jgi:signal transduction histidine kinase
VQLKNSEIVNRLPVLGYVLLWIGFYTWVLHEYFQFSWNIAGWDSFLFTLCLASAAVLANYLMNYFPKANEFKFAIGQAVMFGFLVEWITRNALMQLFIDDVPYQEFLAHAMSVRWLFGISILAVSSVGGIYYRRWKESAETTTRESATENFIREAELQKLQLQLQPHFLFNSLNSINALIITQPEKASPMVQQLSDFLRATLKRADEKWITLAQEVDYLQLYLSIEKVRFGYRLEIEMNVDEQIKLWLIPPLLLQPLVENAIKFGLYGTTGKVSIHLNAGRQGDTLVVEISNPFDKDMQPPEGSGFGLNGLRRRLYLLYARNDLLSTRIENDKFFVSLILPEKYD